MSMVGKIKQKLEKFVDNRIVNYFSKSKKVEDKGLEDVSISMSEAEKKREEEKLTKNLIYSIQKDFNSLKYIKEGKEFAFDSMDTCLKNNTMVGLNGRPQDIVFTFFAKFGYIGWQICSVLAQHWLISNACSISNKDCLRNGWNNIFVDKKDKNESEEEEEKAQEILAKLFDIEQQKYNLNDKLLKWGYYYNVFGTAFMLPIIDGIDDKAREKPYNPDGIKKGSFKGISVIEPYWMVPEFDYDSMTDPTNMNFFEPEYYRTAKGKKIHKSHLIIGRRKFVSDILKPSYYYGGISLAQEIYERVYASEKSANEAPLLLLTKRLNVYKVKLKDLILNPKKYKQIAEQLTSMRDNQGILFADHEDDISQVDTTLSDLDPVIMEQYKIVSAIARIPVDKLYETNPTGGLSASGDYNIKNYNQDLNTLQNDLFKPAIDRINEIVMRSEFEKKDRVGIVFNPTDNPTEKEIAELNEKKANTMAVYLQNGLITPEEARQKLVNDKMSGYSFLKGVEMEEPTEEEQQEIEEMMNKKGEEDKEGKDEDDVDTEWITVKGNHIPIKKGENKEEAIKKFFESKEELGKEGEKEVEKGKGKEYNIGEKEQVNNSQKNLSEISKSITDFTASRDDKNITRDKVLRSIKDFSYEYNGKKYNYSKKEIQKKVKDVEEKIDREKEDTTIKKYLKEVDGKKVWDKDRVKNHHNRILKEIFKNAKKSDNPELIVLGGRGGSGKSRFEKKEGFVVLDSDEIKKQLPEYKGWNTAQLHEEAGYILKRAMDFARQEGISVVLDNTLHGSIDKLKGRIDPFVNNEGKKYKLQIHYLHLPRQKSVQNSISRWLKGDIENGKGRYVPIQAILDMTDNEDNFTKLVESYKPSQYSFSTNDVKKGEGTKYLYGNMEDGGKSLWRKN